MTMYASRAVALLLTAAAALPGCAKKKASASGSSATSASGATGAGGGAAGSGVTTTTTDPTQVSLPSTLSLVDPTSGSSGLDLDAYDLAGATDYAVAKARVKYRFGLASDEAAKTVRGILCFIAGTNYTAHVGEAPYIAVVDQDRCFEANTDNSDLSVVQQNLSPAIIQATSATAGVALTFWLRPNGGDHLIYASGIVTSGPSSTNPFGLFTLNFTNDSGSDAGSLAVGPGADSASVLVQYYEATAVKAGVGGIAITGFDALAANVYPVAGQITSGTYAARVMVNYGAAGAGKGTHGLKNSDVTFGVAFGANRILETGTDGTNNCLKQDVVTTQVGRYALFNAADESAVSLNGGFPLIDASGQAGFIGSGGPSPNLAIKSGDTVYKGDPKAADGKGTAYTAVVTTGKLWKQTRVALTLADIEGLNLDTWKNGKFERVTYDGTNFNVAGTYALEPNGAVFTPAATPAVFLLSAGANQFSSPLGGVMVNTSAAGSTGAVVVGISTVQRSDATGTAGALALYCLNRCPAGLITAAMVTGAGSPYTDPQPTLGSLIPYAWTPATLALTLTGSGTPVALDAGVSSLGGQFSAGLESGPLYLAADYQAATKLNDLLGSSTFYTYVVGTQPQFQDTLLKDASGAIIAFDPPLAFSYVHTTANDANGDATYNGKQFELSYGAYGDLWGIPYTQNPTTGLYAPNLSIASGTLLGPSKQYMILGLGGVVLPAVAAVADCAALDVTKAPPLPTAPAATLKFVPKPTQALKVLVNDGVEATPGS